MAFRMRHWIGVVVFGCAFVAVTTLPLVSTVPSVTLQRTQTEARSGALSADVRRTAATLQHRRLGDSLISLTLSEPGGVASGAPAGLAADEVANQRERVAREVQEGHLEDTRVALGHFLVRRTAGAYAGRGGLLGTTEYFWGERDGRPYCVTMRGVLTRRDGRTAPFPVYPGQDLLGVCGLIARYGLPGPSIETWLASGGTAFASSLEPGVARPDFWSYYGEVAARLSSGPLPLTRLLEPTSGGDLDATQCLAGVTEGCARMFVHQSVLPRWYGGVREDIPFVVPHSPLSAVQERSLFDGVDAHAIADLAAEFGDARVEAFWRTDGDLAEAFESIFGEDLGAWNLRRLKPLMGVRTPGPMPTLAGLFNGMLVVTLCAAVAAAWARKRRVA